MLAGILVFGFLGYLIIPQTNKLNHSLYNRQGLEGITIEKFGDTRMSEVLTKEVMIVSYDIVKQEPVIFTKYAATHKDTSSKMNVKIRDAAQASSAAPIYFDPKNIPGISEALIDGGVIANSPAFYSYLHVKYVLKSTKKVRMISIGTGEKQPSPITSDSLSKVTWVKELGALITNVESNTHDFLNKQLL